MLVREQIKAAVEAVLFSRSEAIMLEDLARVIGIPADDAGGILSELIEEYNESERGVQIVANQSGYVMCTRPQYHDYVKKANNPLAVRLSQAALETLAIIAYRQPVTRTEMEAVRGVKIDRVLHSLLGRGLIEEVGKKDVPGRPGLYATTPEFLRLFGLSSLEDLPQQSEETEND